MTQLEKIGSAHDCFATLLFAIEPRVLIRIACRAAGIEIGEIASVDVEDPRIEIPGLRRRAGKHTVDLVYLVRDANGKPSSVWVFEIQLSEDRGKPRRWALYALAFAVQFEADGYTVLFVPEPELRERIRKQIRPVVPRPILIWPDQIERITDYAEARRRPELTILGCLYHVHEPNELDERVAVFRAAWIALRTFAHSRALRYAVLVMSITPPAVVTPGLEDLRESGDLDEPLYELVSETERKGHSFHRGHQEGLEQGLETGTRLALQRVIVDMLELRGLALSDAQRERIQACESLETLERWYAAVKTAAANQTVDQLLA